MGLLNNLTAYWKLDETSSTRVDSHGSNDLTDNNTVTSTTGKIGNSGLFTATNSEYLSRADNTDLSTGDIDFTFGGWFYFNTIPTGGGVMALIYKWDGTANQREYALLIIESGGSVYPRFSVSSDGAGGGSITTVTSTTAVTTDTWYHILGYHDSVNNLIGITVNAGTPVTAAHTTGVHDGDSAFLVGKAGDDGDQYLDGRADELAFWKKVLPTSDRKEIYNNGNGLAYPFTSSSDTQGFFLC